MNKEPRALEQIADDLDVAETQFCEIRAEMANECAMFGDSGPGSQETLRRMQSFINSLRNEYESHPDYVAPEPMPLWTEDNETPAPF